MGPKPRQSGSLDFGLNHHRVLSAESKRASHLKVRYPPTSRGRRVAKQEHRVLCSPGSSTGAGSLNDITVRFRFPGPVGSCASHWKLIADCFFAFLWEGWAILLGLLAMEK